MVRLRLLDSHGAGFSAIQAAAEATKGKAGDSAFYKYLCPVTVFLKPMSYFSLLRVHCDERKCVHCGKCLQVCPMNVEVNKETRKRKNGTECILCYEYTKSCPKKALH
jgi:polyferredoxin